MAYTPTYETADITAMIVDFLGAILSAFVSNAPTIVGLVILGLIVLKGKQVLQAVSSFFGGWR